MCLEVIYFSVILVQLLAYCLYMVHMCSVVLVNQIIKIAK